MIVSTCILGKCSHLKCFRQCLNAAYWQIGGWGHFVTLQSWGYKSVVTVRNGRSGLGIPVALQIPKRRG